MNFGVHAAKVFWKITILLYGVASVSKIDWIVGLFCERALKKRLYFAKETYNLIDPTNSSQPANP